MDARGRDQIRPIRALLRGLETLETLNRRDGCSVTDVANATALPRTTAYRILETLCQGGFATRDPGDDRYRPTDRVQGLAGGYADEQWVADVAAPELEALCKAVLWPLMLCMVRGGVLQLRVVTDDISPLAIERYAAGSTMDLANSAAGVMRLALAAPQERDALLALAAEQGARPEACAHTREAAQEAERLDYALDLRVVGRESTVALPVRDPAGSLRAILSMRFIRTAVRPDAVVAEYVPRLRASAQRIGEAIPAAEPVAPSPPPPPANDSLRDSVANDSWPSADRAAGGECACRTQATRRECGGG